MNEISSPQLAELKRLAPDPEAQAAYAITLLTPRTPRAALQPALAVLEKRPTPAARPALLSLYSYFDGDGPKRDPAAYIRRAIVSALRAIALPADTTLLSRAVTTIERLPPAFKDEAAPLRATALVVLNQLDDRLAGFHAARLLVDSNTDDMSGEPALSAARVLANQDNVLPLYAYAMQENGLALPEVVGECLRSLTTSPPSLIPGIIERHRQGSSIAVLVGLCDLLIGHQDGPQGVEFLAEMLAIADDPDLVRYLALALLARRNDRLREVLLDTARMETHPVRVVALMEALEPFSHDPQIADALQGLAGRRSRRGR